VGLNFKKRACVSNLFNDLSVFNFNFLFVLVNNMNSKPMEVTMKDSKSDTSQEFVNRTKGIGFGGNNQDINKRQFNTFNQWTRNHNDACSYVNEMRVLRKPLKYYTSMEWAPSPTNNQAFTSFTSVGNQKSYNVPNNLTFPSIGGPTSLGNRRFIENVQPFTTTPFMGQNAVNTNSVDVSSNALGFGIGELTNQRSMPKDVVTAQSYNRWEFLDSNVIQNPRHIIFANGIQNQAGISSRNELMNYTNLNNC
jgi:hypothetical protein